MSYRDKLDKIGPRKLLACDGGGIRGIISIGILARIESELRKSSGNPKLVLADYFDYVAGTSTGAIIATLIALGHSGDEIRDFYLRSGAEMFHKARLWERFRTKFESDNLSADATRYDWRGYDLGFRQAAHVTYDGASQRNHRFPMATDQ